MAQLNLVKHLSISNTSRGAGIIHNSFEHNVIPGILKRNLKHNLIILDIQQKNINIIF